MEGSLCLFAKKTRFKEPQKNLQDQFIAFRAFRTSYAQSDDIGNILILCAHTAVSSPPNFVLKLRLNLKFRGLFALLT